MGRMIFLSMGCVRWHHMAWMRHVIFVSHCALGWHRMILMGIVRRVVFHLVHGMIHRGMLHMVIFILCCMLGMIRLIVLYMLVHGYLSVFKSLPYFPGYVWSL